MKTANKQNSEKNQVINDFGQKIGGAHKDRTAEAIARLQRIDPEVLRLKPLAQVAKMPDFRALYLAGAITEDQARRGWYLWAQIGPKPSASQSWKLRGWAEKAALLIAAVADTLAYGVTEKSQIPEGIRTFQPFDLFNEEMSAANWPAEEYKRGAYFVGYYWTNPNKFSIHTAGKSECRAFMSVAECVAAIRAKVDKNSSKGSQSWSVYKNSAGYWISPKGKPGIKVAQFETSAECWEAYRDTEKLENLYAELKKFPSERRDWNRPRLGADWRKGADLNPDTFAAVFPFRGVEFGNWVNQLVRAANLNECADALQDMASVLAIRPEAVTLSGSLAWAFGSRGIGKALAHYEPARRVINLTKKKGNGCVAHEWFHALDNYIMIQAGKPSLFMVSDCYTYGAAEKSPIFEAAEVLKAALLKSDMYTRSKRIDEFKTKPYWATVTEMAARAFEAVIYYKLEAAGLCNDYLVNIKPESEYTRSDCYPYPTREEAAALAPLYDAFILAAFSEEERAQQVEEAAQLPAPPVVVTYDPVQPIESAPFEAHDEAPAVAASEPMNEDSTDPTPADGVQGAAYEDSEKSQNSKPERSEETKALNKRLAICHLNGLCFRGNAEGEIREYGRNDWAFFIPGKGWVSMPGDDGQPYSPIGGREALKSIKADGGYINYEGFEFVWPMDPTQPNKPTAEKPERVTPHYWDDFKEGAERVPIGFRQYIYEFIEKSLKNVPDGMEWGVLASFHWGIWLKVSGKTFHVYYDYWTGTLNFTSITVYGLDEHSPMSWCHVLDTVLSRERIAFSWPIPDKFHGVVGCDLDGKPIFAGI